MSDERRVPPGALDLAQWPPTKRFAIVSPFAVIGYTNLEYPIAYRARAAGSVQIADGYAAIRDVFRLYRRAVPGDRELLRRYVRERDALGLTVQDGGTLPLAASVEFISEWIDGPVVVHVVIQDGRYWSSRTHLA